MNEAIKSAPKIDEEMPGPPVEAHGYIVTPYARVRGMVGSQESAQASGRYGWAAIRPVRMTVQDRSGEVREVRLMDIQGQALRALALVAALVAVASVVISIFSSRPNRSGRSDRS